MDTLVIKSPKELLEKAKNGYLHYEGNVRIECDIPYVGIGEKLGYLYVHGNLYVGGYLYVGGNCICTVLYWPHAARPTIVGADKVGQVRPPPWQRAHWQKRLGVDLSGCWDEIIPRVQASLPKLLRKKCWSDTERWILEKLQ